MEILQQDEMYKRIITRYFSGNSPKFILVQKTKKKKADNVKEVEIVLPHTLDEAIAFKKDFNKSFPKTYDSTFVESRWNEWWEKKGFYSTSPEEGQKNDHSKRYVLVFPPPNVTGKLHIGHALTCSIEDAIIRWKRMQGYKTVFIPGMDHAGIATQTVVEKKLAKEKISRHNLGREKFLQKVWEWKEEYGNTIQLQMRRMGCSFDWKRNYFTMDEERSVAVQETFCRLFKRGLIYRANRLINWSCSLNTAISNIEVEKIEVKAFEKIKVPGYENPIEFGVLVDFAYKIKDSQDELVVSTTRLETMLGDVAVAVNSNDTRYKHLIGKKIIHPFVKRELTIIADDILVDMNFGTGAVKITPAHDPNDFLCAKRNNLEFINILNEDGTMNENCGKWQGMQRYEVREKMMQEMQDLGLYRGRKKNPMVLSKCSRSGDIIEPMLKPQWYVKCDDVAKRMKECVEKGELILYPSNHNKVWYNFMDNIEDWCISRQLWWGHRIPAYKVKLSNGEYLKKDDEIKWFVGRTEEEAREYVKNEGVQNFTLEQDEDVLDTWFSSALLPFSCVGWPNSESLDFKTFYPNHALETGYDILFFWVAKMVMMGLLICDKLPFKDVILHNIVRTETGEKMSKSKGNVIDPLEIIDGCSLKDILSKIEDSLLSEKEKKKTIKEKTEKFKDGIPKCGTDSLRFSLLSYVNENKDINLDVAIPIRDRLFCNKIWNSYFLVRSNLGDNFQPKELKNLYEADQWILYQFNEMVKNVNDFFSLYKFGNAMEQISTFWIHNFCAFYLEYSKNIQNEEQKESNQQTLFWILERFLRILHPVMPFLTEELYQKLPVFVNKKETISLSEYPSSNEKFSDSSFLKFEQIIELIKEMRQLLGIVKLPKNVIPACYFSSECNEQEKHLVQKYKLFIEDLTKTKELQFIASNLIPKECLKGVSGNLKFSIYLKGLVKVSEELTKIQKNIDTIIPAIEKLEKKISSEEYEKKVPQDVQEKEKKTLEDNRNSLHSLEESKKVFEILIQFIYIFIQ